MKTNIREKKRRLNNKGFTMVETLIVVAITVILLLVGTVGIVQYLKTMHQLEMDGAAKEIFIAAQNHLSMAESQGYLERGGVGKEDTSSKWKGDDVYYFVVDGENSTELTDPDSYLNLMLPYGAIDEEIRTAGSYVVLYQKDTARVVEVYYAKQSGRYSHTFSDTEQEYTAMVDNFGADGEGTQHKKYRRSYGEKIQDFIAGVDNDNAIIGYYGGEIAGLTQGDELYAPSIEVINEDQLLVVINDKVNDGKTHSLKLILHGEKSKVDKEVIVSLESGLSGLSQVGLNVSQQGDGRYGVVLDDITSSNHFYNLFCNDVEPMIPGENISVQAMAYSNTTLTNIAYSSSVKTNSIFADLVPAGTAAAPQNPSETVTTNTVKVAYTRHLENLSTAVSGYAINKLYVTGVEQVKDISFCKEGSPYGDPGFKKNIGGSDFYITKLDGTKETKNCFMPVVYGNGTQALVYDGKNHKITGIEVDTTGAAGLFATLYKESKISNLELVNFNIKSGNNNAGALAGSVNKTEVSGVLAHNGTKTSRTNETKLEISGAQNVGGLIGSVTENSKINLSAASVYVRGGSAAAPSGKNLGGLIGELNGSTVTNSYSGGHTDNAVYSDKTDSNEPGHVNVIGGSGSNVGGLVGVTKNSSIQYAYSTCSVKGSTPSGFAGKAEGGSIKDCYATGQVQSNIAANNTQAFAGVISGTSLSGNSYLLNVSDKDKTTQTAGITGISGNDLNSALVVEEEKRATAQAYDPALIISYGGKYYFPTIEMLNKTAVGSASGVAASLAKYHYGDWEIPEVQDLDFDLFNRDKLYLELYSDPDQGAIETITLAVKGNASGKTEAYVINLSNDGSIEKHYLIDENSVTEPAAPAHYNFQISKDKVNNESSERNGFDMYTVVLDDITTRYSHFNELFPNLKAGENISVYVSGGSLGATEIGLKMGEDINLKKGNSLFGDLFGDCTNGQIGDANIFYIRHLQNLDPEVSKVDAGVTSAYLKKDLDWTATASGKGFITWSDNNVKIWNKTSLASVADTFYGIYNNNLTLFNGNNCTLQHFVIKGASSSISSEGKDNAGLFRLVNNGMKFANTRMDNCQISSSAASAGSAAGRVEGKGMTVEKVLVTGSVPVTSSATGSFGAGGVIGSYNTADTTGSLVITDTAASVKVNSANNAGGIIGLKVNGSASITDSYVGGHTVNGIYETDDAAKYNVVATGSANSFAGGIVGLVSAAGLTVSGCGSAASVAVTSPAEGADGSCAGGIIGKAGAAVTVNNTYTVAPVYDADYTAPAPEEGEEDEEAEEPEEETHVAAAGAFVGYLDGTLNGSGQYYLLDSYSEHGYLEYDDISVKAVGYGTSPASIQPVYYFTMSGGQNPENPIAGISINIADKFAQETTAYDPYLANRDYPFLISAELPQFGVAGASDAVRAYFGDWEPCQKAESEIEYHVEFYYEDPETNVVYKVPTVSGAPGEDVPDLSIQGLVTNEENKVVTPATELVPGWEVTSWVITSDNPSLNITLKATNEGILTLAQDYCISDLKATAKYERVAGETIVQFMWIDGKDESHKTNKLADNEAVITGSSLADMYLPVKDKIVKDIQRYTFEGWYEDPELTIPADFSKIKAEEDYMTFYAKYLPMEYYNVTVDFLYQIDNGETDRLDTTNFYSLKGEQSQYVIESLRGKEFHEVLELPDLAGQEFQQYVTIIPTAYDERGNVILNPSEEEGLNDMIKLSNDRKSIEVRTDEDHQTSFAVVYKISSIATDKYQVIYRIKDTDQNGNAVLTNRGTDEEIAAFKNQLDFKKNNTEEIYLINSSPVNDNGVQLPDNVFLYERGLVPPLDSVRIDLGDGFKCTTKKVYLSDPPAGSDVDYVIYVDYERLKYNFTFDCRSGVYVDPVVLSYGQPMTDALNDSTGKQKTTTRKGYVFNGWRIHSKGASELNGVFYDADGNPENYAASDKMPAKNMVATALWTAATNTPFRVAFWYEDAEKDGHVHQHTIDCFGVTDSDMFAKIEQTYETHQFTYKYGQEVKVKIDERNKKWSCDYNGNSYSGNCTRTTTTKTSYEKNGYTFTQKEDGWYVTTNGKEYKMDEPKYSYSSWGTTYYKTSYISSSVTEYQAGKELSFKISLDYKNDWNSNTISSKQDSSKEYEYKKVNGISWARLINDDAGDDHWFNATLSGSNSRTRTVKFTPDEKVTVKKTENIDDIIKVTKNENGPWESTNASYPFTQRGTDYYITVDQSVDVMCDFDDSDISKIQRFNVSNATFVSKEGTVGYCRYQDGKWYLCDKDGKFKLYKNNKMEVITITMRTNSYDYYKGGKKLNIIAPSSRNMVVGTWTYDDGTDGSGKCILFNDNWYDFHGTVDQYGYAVCTNPSGGDDGYNYMGSVTMSGTTGSLVSASTYQNQAFSGRDASHFTYKDADSDHDVVIEADGSTVVNVRFSRNVYTFTFYSNSKKSDMIGTITAKYGQYIGDLWEPINNKAKGGASVTWVDGKSSSPYNARFAFIMYMPGENVALYPSSTSYSYENTFNYCVESLGSGDIAYGGKNYDLRPSPKNDFASLANVDFLDINGFTRDKYQIGSGTAKSYSSRVSGSIGNSKVNFYYNRNSYDLEFYVEGITNCTKSVSVKFEDTITKYYPDVNTIQKPDGVDSSYTFDGWYLDEDYVKKADETSTMPTNRLKLQGRWVAPTYKVNFYKEKMDEGDVPFDQLVGTHTVSKHENLDGIITDENGEYLGAYKPKKVGYDFEGWYYDDSSGTHLYNAAQEVLADMNVYAKWEKSEEEVILTDESQVTINYVYRTQTDGAITDTLLGTKTIDGTIGAFSMIKAEGFEGYYPDGYIIGEYENDKVFSDEDYDEAFSVMYYKVKKDAAENVITFFYKPLSTWTYNIEYYVVYDSAPEASEVKDLELGGKTAVFTTDETAYLVKRETKDDVKSQYHLAVFTAPEGFEAYHLDHYEYGDIKNGAGTHVIIHPESEEDRTATIKYYMTPDKDLINAESRYWVYNGESAAISSELKDTKTIGTNISFSAYDVYNYIDSKGKPVNSENIVNAGAYNMEGYVVYVVTGAAEGDSSSQTRYFLIKKTVNDSLQLHIARKEIVYTSGSQTWNYDGQMHFLHEVTLTDTKGNPITLIQRKDGSYDTINAVFAADSCVVGKGSSVENKFVVEAGEGTNIDNYLITTQFGTLSIGTDLPADNMVK